MKPDSAVCWTSKIRWGRPWVLSWTAPRGVSTRRQKQIYRRRTQVKCHTHPAEQVGPLTIVPITPGERWRARDPGWAGVWAKRAADPFTLRLDHDEVRDRSARPERHRDGGDGRPGHPPGVESALTEEPHDAEPGGGRQEGGGHRRNKKQGHRAEGGAGHGHQQAGRAEGAEGQAWAIKDGLWSKFEDLHWSEGKARIIVLVRTLELL